MGHGASNCTHSIRSLFRRRQVKDPAALKQACERKTTVLHIVRSAYPGGGRYLSGDLSFFGVGSKNAAFFMGSSVKLATRQAGAGDVVHELCIVGAELERR